MFSATRMPDELPLEFDLMNAIRKHAEERPNAAAFEEVLQAGRRSLSWRCLVDQVCELSGQLVERGVQADDRVAILMENQPRWAVAFLAIQSAGAVAVPLDTMATSQSIAHVVAHSAARLLIVSKRFEEQAQQLRAHAECHCDVITLQAEGKNDTVTRVPLPLRPRSLDDNLAILYTGGTTGRPKGVLLTGRGLGRNITDMLQVFPLSPADSVLCVLPLFHVMPLLANLLAPALMGARVVFLNVLEPEMLRRTFQTEAISAFLCVPQFYYQIQRRILDEVRCQSAVRRHAFHVLLRLSGVLRRNLGLKAGRFFFRPVHAKFGSALRAFGVGGAYFNPDAAEFFRDLGFSFFQAYGMTECSGLATVTGLNRNAGSFCGRPVAHCEVRIGNADASAVGEILIRSENVMKGYWRDPEATAAVLRDGWLHTGDLGSLGQDGSLRITGRAKDVVVLSSGKNVFPEELEEYFVGACDTVQEICFVGVETRDGAVLHCAVFPAGTASAGEARAQIAAAAKQLPAYKRPGSIQVMTEPLPRTTTRKLQRFRVRELAADSEHSSVAASAAAQPGDAVEQQIVKLVQRLRPASATVTAMMHLELDLRLDSLERVELLSNVESAFGIRIPTEHALAISTVQDLVREVRERCSGAAGDTSWTDWPELIRAPLTATEAEFASEYLRSRPLLERWWYGVSRVLGLSLRAGMNLRRQHAVEFPAAPFIICPNHVSYLDTPVAVCLLPYRVFSRMFLLGLSRYFKTPLLKWVASICRIVPLDKDENLMSGMRMGKAGLEKGLVLWVYPEGTRSADGRVQALRKGPALLAQALQIPVVPMGIAGTFEAWPRGRALPRKANVAIATGAALTVSDNETAEAFNERLHAAIVQQLQIAESLRA